MRLIHTPVASLKGRTIVFRHVFWQVIDTEGNDVLLRRGPSNDQRGILQRKQMKDCRLFMNREEIARHYPRLLEELRTGCCLSFQEAEDLLAGMMTTGSYWMGNEAIARIGGAREAVLHALRCRRQRRHLSHN
ncbi:hypothetical protein RY831_14780 [Noviherbaspirillum sp. CPCC 100848]|uniref:Uncharacterized protein n=1 Tax=Noviherbaspirillum album TaxID=3080276 RepID=A0ABU6J9U6_9BURK|nr:hypothetical protein [Noviherbaspirillum sp. CPCC 100848]MEC4720425.1 hypothetical protein [Noviherbaspirillum sp. CPCC 100848]